MTNLRSIIYTFLAAFILFTYRKDKIEHQSDPCMNTTWTSDVFSIHPLENGDHPYNPIYSMPPVTTAYLFDSLGVPALKINGVNYYHPIHISQYAYKLLDWFFVSNTTEAMSAIIKRTLI